MYKHGILLTFPRLGKMKRVNEYVSEELPPREGEWRVYSNGGVGRLCKVPRLQKKFVFSEGRVE